MFLLKEFTYGDVVLSSNHNDSIVLAGDIGGTNSNFGVCSIKQGVVTLLFSLHIKSKEIIEFPDAVDYVLRHIKKNYGLTLEYACFAAAGVVSEHRDRCKPTNLYFEIDTQSIMQKTGLKSAVIINDFEAVGYGLDYIAPDSLITINKGKVREHATRAIIGAGTGLGKGILLWDDARQAYIPLPSEGGHADFPLYTQLEFDFVKFVQQKLGQDMPVSCEQVLSGSGIVRMYDFLGQLNHYEETEYTKEIAAAGANPDQIFKYWQHDVRCADTFAWYGQLYARCAKNFALETLSLGGLYIAGGIAAKNIPLFENPEFMPEFTQSVKHVELLHKIPVTVIADYNVSLFGAAAYLALIL